MDISTPLNIARGDTMDDFDFVHSHELSREDDIQNDIDPLNMCELTMQTEQIPDPLLDSKARDDIEIKMEALRKYEESCKKDAQRNRAKRKSLREANSKSKTDPQSMVMNKRSKAAYAARIRRQNMTSEEKEKMREADKMRAQRRRSNETPEERAERNKRDAERRRKRRHELAQFKKLLEQLESSGATVGNLES